MEKEQLKLNIYGITISIDSTPEILERLKRDFSYFINSNTDTMLATRQNVIIKAYLQTPPYEIVPKSRVCFKKNDLSWTELKEKRFIDYNGKALSVYDYKQDSCEIYSEDIDLLHELTYLLIHSRVGEMLDKNRIHRVHALGISFNQKGVLCLLPQGGGKTTLCLELLKGYKIGLLSDDTPLITKTGAILPFPARIGVNASFELNIAKEYLGQIVRRKYGTKKLIDIEYFKDKISKSVPASVLLIGNRISSKDSSIVKAGKLSALIPMFKNCIIGIGLPQMTEYFIRFELKDIIKKTIIFASRLLVSLNLIYKTKVYVFNMGTDINKNALILNEHMEKAE